MLDDARIFHININCSDLTASRAFYLACGLAEGIRTTPDTVQSGAAFGLDRARWDAWILVGTNGFEGGAIDLLEWHEPPPKGTPPHDLNESGFQRVGLEVSDLGCAIADLAALGNADFGVPNGPRLAGQPPHRQLVRDPDGVAVELIDGSASRLSFVAVTCHDLERSVAFYRRLGFRDLPRTPDGEVPMEAPSPGEVRLVLAGIDASTVRVAPPRVANALGMWRMALLLPDLDRAVLTLRAACVELLSDPQAMSMGPGVPDLRFVCFRGPDDEVIELIEMPEGT